MATPVGELNLPFVSLMAGPGERERNNVQTPWLINTELGYLISRYDDAIALLRDPRWHSARPKVGPERDVEFVDWLNQRQPNLLVMNGDDHRRLRRVLGPWLTPHRVDSFRSSIRQTFAGLLEAAVDDPKCEFISHVCEPYATHVAFDLVGASALWRERFRSLAGDRTINMGSPSHEIIEISEAFDELVAELLDDEAPAPSNSLLEAIRLARSNESVSHDEAVMLVQSVIGGASDSTLAQLGSAVWLFARFDDEFQRLRRQPELVAQAVEEVMRFQGAARGTARVAIEDVEIHDVLFPKGTRVTLAFVSANRDPAIYRAPRRFDIMRTDEAPHLSFGHGAHFCVGAALARIELSEALSAIAAQVSRIELMAEVQWREPSVDFWGPSSLSVRLRP